MKRKANKLAMKRKVVPGLISNKTKHTSGKRIFVIVSMGLVKVKINAFLTILSELLENKLINSEINGVINRMMRMIPMKIQLRTVLL